MEDRFTRTENNWHIVSRNRLSEKSVEVLKNIDVLLDNVMRKIDTKTKIIPTNTKISMQFLDGKVNTNLLVQ